MTIRFQCPACGRNLKSPDAKAGRQTNCVECGAELTIPAAEMANAVSAGDQGAIWRASVEEPAEESILSKGVKSTVDAEMDMTPMVDVTFLLLIFFMVTAAFALQKSIEIPPTKEEEAQSRTIEEIDEDKETVIVRIDGDNVFWVSSPNEDKEQEAPSEVELLNQLRAARGGPQGGASKLLVMASGDARHEFVVRALDAGTAVGMEEIKLSTIEDEE